MFGFMRRGRRRNPSVLGLSVEDGLAGAFGIYATSQGGELARHLLPAVAQQLDAVRPGLSTPVAEVISAVAVRNVAGWFGLTKKYRPAITLGAAAKVMNDALAALLGQVNLIGGTPSWNLGFNKPAPAPDQKALPGAGATDRVTHRLGLGSMGA